MREWSDILAQTGVVISALIQLIPIYYAVRLCRMSGRIRYWTMAWVLFAIGMGVVMMRRLFSAMLYDCSISPSWAWYINMTGVPALTSLLWTVFTKQLHYFFARFIENGGKECVEKINIKGETK